MFKNVRTFLKKKKIGGGFQSCLNVAEATYIWLLIRTLFALLTRNQCTYREKVFSCSFKREEHMILSTIFHMFSNQLDYYMVQNKCYIVNIIKILSTEQENRDPILCVYNLISFYPISAYSNLEIHLIFWLNYLDKITCNKFTRFSFIFLLLPKQKKTQSSVTSRPCHGKSPDDMLKYPVTWHTEMTHQRTITNFCLPFQHLLSERLASLGQQMLER